jgi:hypothetical protein
VAKYIALIACALIACPAFTSSATAQDLQGIVQQYLEAYNSHDVDRIMSFYTDDARFEEEGFLSREGFNELRIKAQWDKATNSSLEVRRLDTNGSVVTGRGVEFSQYYTAAGLPQYNYETITFTFQGTKIKEIKVVPESDSVNNFTNALGQFVVWGSNPQHGMDMNKLKEGGTWAYTANTAPHWISMLNQWRQAKVN